jgi:hypothetical protein
MTPVEALQKALAAEHAAVHLYGVLGAQSSKSRQPTLFRQLDGAYDEHRALRDRLTVLVSAKGQDPVAAEVDYAVPGPTSTPAQIQAVARTIERRVTRTYGELVENTSGADRQWAITALDAGALRELDFGTPPNHFPGLA